MDINSKQLKADLTPAHFGDVLLPVGVIGLLLVMLIPLPSFLLDLFLSFSITLALLILLVTMHAGRPVEFSVFPSVLLLTTLFRLALNIASTRAILLHGNTGPAAAGEVIRVFGEFVVGGNYAVGIVVFSILVIINFVVITKGATRIAEVAARFTLDAMPGRQMSIDADLNAGIIDETEARKRRELIAQEADFYGSMDGASKFVRGDAMAALMIIFINVLGGLAIGVLEHNMSFVEAAKRFTLLTVGDAIVAQIPALIMSTAAGIIITRVSTTTSLGRDLTEQIFFNPQLVAAVSGMLFFMGFLPGLPHFAFLSLASFTAALAYKLWQRKQEAIHPKPAEQQKEKAGTAATDNIDSITPPDLLELHVGYGLVGLVDQAQGGELLERIRSIRRQTALDLGFVVPSVHIRDNLQLKPHEYSILLKGIQVAKGELLPRHVLAINPGHARKGLEGKPGKDPCFGLPALWIAPTEKERAQMDGYTVVDGPAIIATHLTEIIKSNGHELLGRQEVQNLLDNLAKTYPKVVDDLIPAQLTLGSVVRILKNLLRERVSIRDLRSILEAVADYTMQSKDPDTLTEYARQNLSRTISHQYMNEEGVVQVISLDPALDRRLTETMKPHGNEGGGLPPSLLNQVVTSMRQAIDRVVGQGYQPVLLCSQSIRSQLFRVISPGIHALAVLSPNELDPKVKIQAIEVVRLPHEAETV
ncbi:MAG: flagellar biosynthesis protein FlhA [Nitrospira sp.]|nr:flagellar biosynthesis protein FlhA [Nitrospira sp.]MCA9474746.1 flagellar biosynthesis protein FlhA [Nitrospira sp.]MCB9711416.1 flagellar biosynthesis protein FlhA [Nitrospiraceae bacterium]MDR4486269.1 flagellar biosynthesis protein FlhA [Nitrospirales bacterium]